MKDNEITQAKEELKTLQDDIIERKRALSKLSEEKERWFQKRAEIGAKIAENIREVKGTRQERDKLTTQVQEEKKERRNFSQEIRDKIAEVKKLREQRKKAANVAGISVSPGKLKKEIERIEYRLQTEPMPYNEERKLTAALKEKKAAFGKIKGQGDLSKNIRELSKEIDELKKQSDEVHEQLQERAEQSQDYHETVIEKSKKIDALKQEEDDAYKKFSELKDEYVAKREELQAVIDKAEEIRKELGLHGEQVQRVEKKKAKEILKEKSAAVEEKVKKKQTLTTEDLLAFQAGE